MKKELLDIDSGIPKYIKNLLAVISFDEFKGDTKSGKYAFILNDPIHNKVLDILPERKKECLIQYFTHCKSRHSVKAVISDMYEPYLLVTRIIFPKSIYIAEAFHYTRYIMKALDNIRIRLQKIYSENSNEYKILKSKKNIGLLRKYGKEVDWWVITKRYKNGHMVYNDYYLKEEFLDIINHNKDINPEEQL